MTSASATRPVRVAVVNDHPVVVAGVAGLLQPYGHRVEVKRYAGDLPPRGRVDVVLFDGFGCADPLGRLTEIMQETGAKVLVYSWAQSQARIDAALRAGAAGFLPKTVDGEDIVAAVEAVVA